MIEFNTLIIFQSNPTIIVLNERSQKLSVREIVFPTDVFAWFVFDWNFFHGHSPKLKKSDGRPLPCHFNTHFVDLTTPGKENPH